VGICPPLHRRYEVEKLLKLAFSEDGSRRAGLEKQSNAYSPKLWEDKNREPTNLAGDVGEELALSSDGMSMGQRRIVVERRPATS